MSASLEIRHPDATDLPAIAALLIAEGLGDKALQRLSTIYADIRGFSLVATSNRQVQGVMLASFNGWHVFVSHLVVAPSARSQGIGRLLIERLASDAARMGAKAIIVDARLSVVGFFHKLQFRTPAAVFLIRDLP